MAEKTQKTDSSTKFLIILSILLVALIAAFGLAKDNYSTKTPLEKTYSDIDQEPERVYAYAQDLDVKLTWIEFSLSYPKEDADVCSNGYDEGNIWADIYITNNKVTEPYSCTSINEYESNSNLRKAVWDIKSKRGFHADGYIVASLASLKKQQSFRFCCESYDGESNFCKTITLDSYC